MIQPNLHRLLEQARTDELLRGTAGARQLAAAHVELGPPLPRRTDLFGAGAVTLRFAFPDDRASLCRLAALDEASVPAEPVLIAEVGGILRAALSLADDELIADPFHRSTELAELLRARAVQLRRAEHRVGVRARWSALWLALRTRLLAGAGS